MPNIFKYIPIFSDDFIPFKCREIILNLRRIFIHNASSLHDIKVLLFDLLTYSPAIYLHLNQCEDLFALNSGVPS